MSDKKVGASKDMPTLVIDGNYIAHRANFSMGSLSSNNVSTGTMFGFMKEVLKLMQKFHTNDLIFCWDSKESLRKEEFPEYKKGRGEELTPLEKRERQEMHKQIKNLKFMLPSIGWANQREQKGYEGDDMIATTVMDEPKSEYIVVTNDGDLYQMLDLCSIYDFKRLITEEIFTEEWGITPEQWGDVKVLAGCKSDKVPGVTGCGEKTAIKYLLGTLGTNTKIYKAIVAQEKEIYKKNEPLVVLPKEGTKEFPYFKNEFNLEELKYWFIDYDFRSFLKDENFMDWEDCLLGNF